MIHLDHRGRILEANDHALETLRRREGLFEERGFLHAVWPSDDVPLQHMLQESLPLAGEAARTGSMTLRRAGRPRLTLYAAPVSSHPSLFGSWSASALLLIVGSRQAQADAEPLV